MIQRRTPLPRSQKPIARTAVKKRRAKPRKVSVARDDTYLEELRGLYCAVGILRGSEVCCSGIIDPAHGPVNGMSSKGSDYGAIPLCRTHHREQHALGWETFEAKYGFSRETEAAKLKAAWDGWKK